MADEEARLRAEGLDPSSWSNGPGARYPVHRHGYDKVIVVARGSITFGLSASSGSLGLAVGDRLELRPGPTMTRSSAGLASSASRRICRPAPWV